MQQGHVHLVSTYRFPSLAQLHPDKVAEYLLGAPKIARDQSPFYWTYLDRPADGTVLLIWQSVSLGPEFPSDGYVWSPGESPYAIDVPGGYVSTKQSSGDAAPVVDRPRLLRCTSKRPATRPAKPSRPIPVDDTVSCPLVPIPMSPPRTRLSGSSITRNAIPAIACLPT